MPQLGRLAMIYWAVWKYHLRYRCFCQLYTSRIYLKICTRISTRYINWFSQDVPSSGIKQWYPLQKPDGKSKRSRGEVKAGLTLSTEKDQNLTAQEHRHLLKILFSYELQHSQVMIAIALAASSPFHIILEYPHIRFIDS